MENRGLMEFHDLVFPGKVMDLVTKKKIKTFKVLEKSFLLGIMKLIVTVNFRG